MKNIQHKIKNFCEINNLNSSPEYRILDAMSELGEVAKEMLKMTNYGNENISYRKEMEVELGDLFFSIITIANSLNIDLENALNLVLIKYEKRLQKGSAGSEND